MTSDIQWPTFEDLEAWALYEELCFRLIDFNCVMTPEQLKQKLKEIRETPPVILHGELNQVAKFHAKFLCPTP